MTSYFYDMISGKSMGEYVADKEKSAKHYFMYMLIRLQKMFKYENLPETIPKEMLENYLLLYGKCFITKHEDKLYAFHGTMGGAPDEYYRPTKFIVANPALELSKEYDIKDDGVLIRNDDMRLGLYPLMSRYASLLAENVLTIRSADVMLRVLAMLTAPDDKTKIAAEEYLKKLEDGKFGVIAENRFFEGIKMQSPPSNNGSYLTQFIELQQYLKASFFNEIGLNANFNMKREAIGQGESALNEDSLLPLCENMLECRKKDIEKVNEMFGTDIIVEFDSSWKNNQKELFIELEKLQLEASQLVEEPAEIDSETEIIEDVREEIEIVDEENEIVEEVEEVNDENEEIIESEEEKDEENS